MQLNQDDYKTRATIQDIDECNDQMVKKPRLLYLPRGVGQDHVNTNFADSALLLPLKLYRVKRRPFCCANKTCRALL